LGAGVPDALYWKVYGAPTIPNESAGPLVKSGPSLTVRPNACVELGAVPLAAMREKLYTPPEPTAGVPLRTPVTESSVTPLGRVPDVLNEGAGEPVLVAVNVPLEPTVKVVLFALVMPGAWLTVSVKFCVAAGLTPLAAMNEIAYVPVVPA